MPKLTPTDPDSLGKVMGRLPQAGSVVKMASYKEHKKLFTTVWLQFLALKVRTLTPGGYGSNLKSRAGFRVENATRVLEITHPTRTRVLDICRMISLFHCKH